MKSLSKTLIIIAGSLNLLMGLFHIFLCYNIWALYGNQPIYPLLQEFAVGGAIFIWFLALTSLLFPFEMVSTRIGRSVIVLNIATYVARIAGEFILSPVPQPAIIGACLLPTAFYSYALFLSLTRPVGKTQLRTEAA